MSMVEIIGGAGPREAAAIMAVVVNLLQEEKRVRTAPLSRTSQSDWVLALHAPLASPSSLSSSYGQVAQSDPQWKREGKTP